MSTQQKRTLVIDLQMLESSRDLFLEMAKSPADCHHFQEQAALVQRIIKYGTTVDMAPEKVAGFAKALIGVAEIREDIWRRPERERFYSEADSADADWTPSGGAA